MLPADPMTVDPINLCCQFANNDERTTGIPLNQIATVLNDLPQCPPTRAQMDLGTMFMRFPDLDVAGVECFRSNDGKALPAALKPVKFHTVCCYANG